MRGNPPWHAAEPLLARTRATPDRTAVIDATGEAADAQSWSYRRLHAATDVVTERLQALLPPEPSSKRIGLAVSPRVPYIVTLYAALRLGWAVVPLDPAMTGRELDERLRRTDPALLVCERDSESLCLPADRPVASVDQPDAAAVSSLAGAVSPSSPAADSARARRADERPPFEQEGTAAEGRGGREAVVLFTSGTTGQPKGVRLTLSNLLASAIGSAFRLGVTPSDRWLGCLPVHHMGGLAPVLRSVYYGTTLVLQGGFDIDRTRELLADAEITGVSLVPTQLKRLLDVGWEPPSGLRSVLLGGAPASNSLLTRAVEAGVPVCPTYGLTEAASQVATARPREVRADPDTVGQPLLWTTVTILADGDPVGSGQRGEIVVDGPTITPGYLDEETTDGAFGEWGLHTGDLGIRDEDGRLEILGRVDDVINTGGELVAPAEVVSTLEPHPHVAAAAVVGVDDPEWGERVAALVVPESDDGPLDTAALFDYCRERLSAYKAPKTILQAPELPRTASGTVDRDAVAAEIARRKNE